MTKPLPRPGRHLQAFGISLAVLVAALAVLLFAVTMEDTASGTGVITSGRIVELRSTVAGQFRLRQPSVGPGAVLANGDALADVTGDGPATKKWALGPADAENPVGADGAWQVLELPVRSGQRVAEGDVVARLLPVSPAEPDRLPEPLVRLAVDEKQFGGVARGQEVRLYSAMYPHRVRGVARGRVERLEPAGEAGPSGNRVFHAWVAITDSPFPLRLGSSVRAEIILGRKPTYQIILEH